MDGDSSSAKGESTGSRSPTPPGAPGPSPSTFDPCPECGALWQQISKAPRRAPGPRRVANKVGYILVHMPDCSRRSQCSMDTDGDGNCPVHRDCANLTRW